MGTITCAKTNCKQCGICIKKCPMQLIGMNEENFPSMSKANEIRCISCGHCEASCPYEALSVEGENLKGSVKYPVISIDKTMVEYLIKSRRSIRVYADTPVEKELVEELFETVRYAPSAVNSQCVKWMIIDGKKRMKEFTDLLFDCMKKIAENPQGTTPFHAILSAEGMGIERFLQYWEQGINPIFYNAPHLAIAFTHKNARTSSMDAMIALAYLDITLAAHGLGGCWAGIFHIIAMSYPHLAPLAGLPKDHVISGGMMFGYPQEVYPSIPKRNRVDLVWN